MKAAILHAVDDLSVEDVHIDAPGPDEVLVRTVAAGVCHSDLSYIDGAWPASYPFLPGHEGAGVVESVGSAVTYVRPGDHVVTCVSLFCGSCRFCLSGRPNLCPVRPQRAADDTPRLLLGDVPVTQLREIGSFAEQMLVHQNSLALVPKEIPMDVASLLGCGVLTGTGAVFNTARVKPGATVAVVGCGGVGLNLVQAARLAGAGMIIAVDRLSTKLDMAASFGATHLVNAAECDAVQAVHDLTDGGAEFTFEAIGRPDTAGQAVEMLTLGGTATIVGIMAAGASFEVKAWTLLRDRTVKGCIMGSNRFRTDIPMLAGMYLDGRLELDSLISGRYGLGQVQEAVESTARGEVARNVLVFDQ